ncbi:hemolysin family protein [Sphingosinicella sp. YJ22]|uniref:hemolysin family protein n=1 Tax=Sphingosinicella sp. YJ22 TaxID=1104780 RepID=UPI00140B5512|nr:hemolysin family protein [Sphingosinicella sp. YJ22]
MPSPETLAPIPWLDVGIILLLIALNGVLAMSELAIVSARRPRLKALERTGRRGATAALALAADPGRFLSAVQIGITLIGILAGAYSGASLGGPIGQRIAALGLDPDIAARVGFTIVIVLVTYVSLVIGELVPKQFALRSPERIAIVVAVPMQWVARITAPLVWLLDRTSSLIFSLLRMNRESADHVTAEDLHMVVAEATHAGVLEESERAIISGVVRLADRPTREIMTPRTDVDWIDADADAAAIREFLRSTPHSRIPVAEGTVDNVIGVVQSRDIIAAALEGAPVDLRALMREVPIIHDRMDAMDALRVLQESGVPMVFVHDEYGHFDGLVTPADLLTALAGAFASDADLATDPPLVERDDGSWWVSGSVSADILADRLGIPLPADRDYATAAGFALSVLKHLPEVGERFRFGGWQFEIVDMDGRKIDKLLASEIKTRRRG